MAQRRCEEIASDAASVSTSPERLLRDTSRALQTFAERSRGEISLRDCGKKCDGETAQRIDSAQECLMEREGARIAVDKGMQQTDLLEGDVANIVLGDMLQRDCKVPRC